MDTTYIQCVYDTIHIFLVNDTISTALTNDTIIVRNIVENNTSTTSLLDAIYKIAMIMVGLFNLGFAIYIFYFNFQNTAKKELKQNRKAMLDTLVLKYKLSDFYKCFGELNTKSQVLVEQSGDMDSKKIKLDDAFMEIFADLRMNFIEALGAIDEDLYRSVLDKADNLQGILSENLFDEGVNRDVPEKYDELIQNPIAQYQKGILSLLYKFE